MITNERQYRITRSWAEKFRQAIAAHDGQETKAVDPKLRKWERDGLVAKLSDLEGELRDYEALKTTKGRRKLAGQDLGQLLIQARIARGWSQRELAERLGLHMQAIADYEKRGYARASLNRLQEVAQALGVMTKIQMQLVELPDLATLKQKPAATLKS